MSDRVDAHFGDRIRSRMKALGLTLADVAAVADLRFRQLHKYECGLQRISAGVLYRIALALEIDVAYFFEGLTATAPARVN